MFFSLVKRVFNIEFAALRLVRATTECRALAAERDENATKLNRAVDATVDAQQREMDVRRELQVRVPECKAGCSQNANTQKEVVDQID